MGTQHGAVLVLAAGSGSRFGSDKRLATISTGETLLSASIAAYAVLPWPLYVVLKDHEQLVQEQTEQALRQAGVNLQPRWIIASDAALGMGHSLAAGATRLIKDGVTQALIGLGDMPFLQGETIAACAAALTQSQDSAGNAIVRPRHAGRPGNPVGFAGARLADLQSASGDTGARPVLRSHAAAIHWLDVADPGIHTDIDRPEDLSASAIPPGPN
ncbi:MAG: NTP transferase domain-containing protein [Pseudomonadales bacterium]